MQIRPSERTFYRYSCRTHLLPLSPEKQAELDELYAELDAVDDTIHHVVYIQVNGSWWNRLRLKLRMWWTRLTGKKFRTPPLASDQFDISELLIRPADSESEADFVESDDFSN